MARAGYTAIVKGGKKLDALVQKVRRAQARPAVIEVGLFESARYQDGTSVAMVGAIHQFGAPNNKLYGRPAPIPARPWFTSALPKIEKAVREIVRDNVDPRNPVLSRAAAGKIGAVAKGILQESITELSQPPLSETTIKLKRAAGKKGRLNVLIDTGFMRASVSYEVRIG